MAIFTGAGVAIITPFHEDGSINYDQLKRSWWIIIVRMKQTRIRNLRNNRGICDNDGGRTSGVY